MPAGQPFEEAFTSMGSLVRVQYRPHKKSHPSWVVFSYVWSALASHQCPRDVKHRLGAEPKRCLWQMKRGGSVVSKRVMQAAAKQDEYYEPDRASEAQRDLVRVLLRPPTQESP